MSRGSDLSFKLLTYILSGTSIVFMFSYVVNATYSRTEEYATFFLSLRGENIATTEEMSMIGILTTDEPR